MAEIIHLAQPIRLDKWSKERKEFGICVTPLIQMIYGDGLYVVAVRLA